MSVNGVGYDVNSYPTTAAKTTTTKAAENSAANEKTPVKESQAAVYEKGSSTGKTTGKADTVTIEKMKADAEARTAQLRSLVEKMMMKQGQKVTSATDYLTALRNGTLQVDDATRKQAQDDISENGYWGVEQTSDRLVSFAKALAGDDPSKADELMAAIEKGFKQATKAWGDELPEICGKTLEATREKMNAWKDSIKTNSVEE